VVILLSHLPFPNLRYQCLVGCIRTNSSKAVDKNAKELIDLGSQGKPLPVIWGARPLECEFHLASPKRLQSYKDIPWLAWPATDIEAVCWSSGYCCSPHTWMAYGLWHSCRMETVCIIVTAGWWLIVWSTCSFNWQKKQAGKGLCKALDYFANRLGGENPGAWREENRNCLAHAIDATPSVLRRQHSPHNIKLAINFVPYFHWRSWPFMHSMENTMGGTMLACCGASMHD